MPSFARNQFLDMDDLLCKQLLGLDIGVLSTASTVGYKNHGKSCTSSSAPEAKPETPHWLQPKESHWSKTGFWADRSISMVEGDVGGLGWASDNFASLTAAAALAGSTSSLSSGATSSRYKTELCRTFTERGMCKYGSKCQFAHGPDELRDISRHPKYKTEPCRTFHSIGFCPYGIRCHFVHNNDEDENDVVPHRPQRPTFSTSVKRPPLLKQSFSFAGFPSNSQPPEAPVSFSSFLPRLSTSPPSRETISDLLPVAFPELSPSPALEPMCDSFQQFLPSPDSGYSQFDSTSPAEPVPGTNGPSLAIGTRSPSLASLSDHDGCCTSSSSSLSGSDFSDAAAKRLPIFSQLSVPDDGFCSEGSASFFL